MAKKTKNNHFLAKVQTKPWLDGGFLNYIDTESKEIGRDGQNRLFARKKIFPQVFEDFLCDHIENFLETVRNLKSPDEIPRDAYRALWLLFVTTAPRILRSKGDESISMDFLNQTAKNLSEYGDAVVQVGKEKGEEIALFHSHYPLFFSDSGLFALPYSYMKGPLMDRAAIAIPLDRYRVLALIKKEDNDAIIDWLNKKPYWLRESSISCTSSKIIFHPDDLNNFKKEDFINNVVEVKSFNKQKLESIENLHKVANSIEEIFKKYGC